MFGRYFGRVIVLVFACSCGGNASRHGNVSTSSGGAGPHASGGFATADGGAIAAHSGAIAAQGGSATGLAGLGSGGTNTAAGGTPSAPSFGGVLSGGFEVEVNAPPAAHDVGQRIIPSCDADSDSDGDRINDFYEGRIEDTPELSPDADGDGIPNYLDAYSDGQGIPDIQQSASDLCAPPPDTDLDSVPDFLDIDNDGDGLTDAEELAAHTDPFDADSDGNGCVDAVDVSEGECDPKAHVRPDVPCDVRVFESRLELRVGNTFSGELTDVSVHVEYDQRLIQTSGVLSVRVAPPEPADSFSVYNGVLQSVRPGAVLTVGVIVSPPINNLFVRLSVESESQGELARGSLALIGPYGCPQPG